MQILAVNDHHDRRRSDLRNIRASQSELSGQERHRIRLAAAGSAKVCAALAVLGNHGFYDTLLQQARSKELRIAADDLFFAAVVFAVLEIDVVAEQLKKARRVVDALDHGLNLIKGQR